MKHVCVILVPEHGHVAPIAELARRMAYNTKFTLVVASRFFARLTDVHLLNMDELAGRPLSEELCFKKTLLGLDAIKQAMRLIYIGAFDRLIEKIYQFNPDIILYDGIYCGLDTLLFRQNIRMFQNPLAIKIISYNALLFNENWPTIRHCTRLFARSSAKLNFPWFPITIIGWVWARFQIYRAYRSHFINLLGKNLFQQLGTSLPNFTQGGLASLVFTTEEFQPNFIKKNNIVHMGPCIANTSPFPFDFDKPLVYISAGTMELLNNNQISLFTETAYLLAEDFQVCASLGTLRSADHSNPWFFSFAPQLQLLQKASVFITHGGMNSVNEAIYFSVPMIVVPLDYDQPFVAKRVANLGLGIAVNINKLTPHKLVQLVKNVYFDVNIRSNLKIASASSRAYNPVHRFNALNYLTS